MKTNEQIKVAESKVDSKVSNEQTENGANLETQQKPSVNNSKKPLTPYQKYKNSRNQNGKKYFDFYDDIKVYTHNIYDW